MEREMHAHRPLEILGRHVSLVGLIAVELVEKIYK
jgi:hypothetical protein